MLPLGGKGVGSYRPLSPEGELERTDAPYFRTPVPRPKCNRAQLTPPKHKACRSQACTMSKHAQGRHKTCTQSHAHARAETTKRMHTTTMKHHISTQQVSAHIPLPTSTKSIPPSPTAVPACRHALTHSTAICNGKQGTHGK